MVMDILKEIFNLEKPKGGDFAYWNIYTYELNRWNSYMILARTAKEAFTVLINSGDEYIVEEIVKKFISKYGMKSGEVILEDIVTNKVMSDDLVIIKYPEKDILTVDIDPDFYPGAFDDESEDIPEFIWGFNPLGKLHGRYKELNGKFVKAKTPYGALVKFDILTRMNLLYDIDNTPGMLCNKRTITKDNIEFISVLPYTRVISAVNKGYGNLLFRK